MNLLEREARRTALILAASNAVVGSAAPISISMGALAGSYLLEADKSLATGTPLTRFEDLGDPVRESSPGEPARRFKLWRLSDPAAGKGSQVFLSTVVGDEVVMLNALVSGSADDQARFEAVRAEYIARFRPLAAEDCAGKP